MQALLFIIPIICFTGSVNAGTTDSLKSLFHTAAPAEKIIILNELAADESLLPAEQKEYAMQALREAQSVGNVQEELSALGTLASITWEANATDEAKMYFSLLEKKALALRDVQTAGVATNDLGLIFQMSAQYDSALIHYQRAIDYFISAANEKEMAQVKVNVGIIYKNIGFYEDAVVITMDALKYLEKYYDSTTMASAYNNIGNAMKEIENYKEAEYYFNKALAIRLNQADTAAQAGVLNNLGNVYRNWGKLDSALNLYQRSLKLKEIIGDKILLASTIDNIGEVQMLMGKPAVAEKYFIDAYSLRMQKNYIPGIITSSNRIAKLYLEKRQTDSALIYARQALELADQSNIRKEKLESYRLMKIIQRQRGNYEKALRFADLYMALYDSIFTEEKLKKIAYIEIKYRTDQYIKDLALSKEKENAQRIEIKNQNLIIAALAIAILSVGIIAFLIYRNLRTRKKAANIEKMLRQEIQHRVKNQLQLIMNVLQLQIQHESNQKFKNQLLENESRIRAITLVHQSLYKEGFTDNIPIKKYVQELLKNLQYSFAGYGAEISVQFEGNDISLPAQLANNIGLIINELLTNAFKYAFPEIASPAINIKTGEGRDSFSIQVSYSARSWDYNASKAAKNSLGLTLVEMMVEQMQGTIGINISDEWTKYILVIPVKQANADHEKN